MRWKMRPGAARCRFQWPYFTLSLWESWHWADLSREESFVCCGNALASAIAKQQEQLRRRRGCFVMSLQAGSNGHREAWAPPAPREGEPQTASNPDGRFSFSPRGFWRRLQRVKKNSQPKWLHGTGQQCHPPTPPPAATTSRMAGVRQTHFRGCGFSSVRL